MIGRVLFVDTDRSLLGELEPELRSTRGDWAIVCAMSAPEALDLLSRDTFDAVVAGVGLPGSDTSTFLDEVSARQPGAARFELSRESGPAMLLRADGAAHQHLARPLRAGEVFARLRQTLLLNGLLNDPQLRGLVSRLKSVPSPPQVYLSIMTEMRKEEPSSRQVGELVARDAGMAAKLLQLVNSPFFGLRMSVCDPVQAVQLLGLETIRALVLSTHVFEQLDLRTVTRFRLGRIWRHSLATGAFARVVARLEGGSDPSGEAFTASLLHDIGKLVLAASLSEDYGVVVDQAESDGTPMWIVERDMLGATHADVGAYLLGLWGLPQQIVEAVAWHHRPLDCASPDYCPLGAVHAADVIEHRLHPADAAGGTTDPDAPYLERFGLASRLPAWTAACLEAEGLRPPRRA